MTSLEFGVPWDRYPHVCAGAMSVAVTRRTAHGARGVVFVVDRNPALIDGAKRVRIFGAEIWWSSDCLE
jgi:hypothetical protein